MTPEPRTRQQDVWLTPLAVSMADFRRQVIFDCCKWDPQVGDTSTISDHACLLAPNTAAHLSNLAESLSRETLALEQALSQRPDLFGRLAIPRPLRKLLARPDTAGDPVRVMRFDFHPTSNGWALSEVNSDVPGGYAEASMLPRLASTYASSAPGGDPAAALLAAMSHRLPPGARIAFVHATAYSDDRQVMQFLAREFSAEGFVCILAAPDHVRWEQGRPVLVTAGQAGPTDAIIRFYPAEWLPLLQRSTKWPGYFNARAVMTNPPHALLSQSKRLPLVWDALGLELPAWRSALPETRDPRDAPWRTDDGWVLKPAMGRVGENIGWRGSVNVKDWRRMARSASLFPRHWIAQRRFDARPVATRDGPRNLCVGVFTVDSKAAGFYGRLSSRAIIEKHAQDVSVLVASQASEDRHVA